MWFCHHPTKTQTHPYTPPNTHTHTLSYLFCRTRSITQNQYSKVWSNPYVHVFIFVTEGALLHLNLINLGLNDKDHTANHRIKESLRLEKTSKIIRSNHQPTPPCLLNHIPKCHIYTFFEHLQGWWLHHCPGQPVPMPDHSLSKEIFPNI